MGIFVILTIVFLVLWLNAKATHKKEAKKHEDEVSVLRQESEKSQVINQSLEKALAEANSKVDKLSPYQDIVDAKAEAEKIRSSANIDAKLALENAKEKAQKTIDSANQKLTAADTESARIISEAEENAKSIAGKAYEAAGKAEEYERTVEAMKNIIHGYGDQYLKPTYSLLDELADDFGYTEAGQALKQARSNSARMVKDGIAATCDYVENNRKFTAIAFVVDAFNGKVDSILSKTKKDNFGTLEQKIKDAYQLVNYNGTAFRNARITPEYLSARLEELKWAVTVNELKFQAQEEQRQAREQAREEEKARREYERAIKDAQKEEAMLQKAMEKAQQQIAAASAEKKAEYEAKLDALKQQLKEAEERGQRAVSLAQQTKQGHVYVISNIGSFGENVYKVGMTRRFIPEERIKELGDASVPFSFDIHAMIKSDDAPALESDLHKALSMMQMNKVNPRKEFFKVSLSDIKALVESRGLKADWTMAAEAAEYRETIAIEEQMKSDPEMQKRWADYMNSVSASSEVGSEED